jgi:hypothetical protein
MRPEIAEPVRDQNKLKVLAPLMQQIYQLHEAGLGYVEQLKQASRIAGRVIDIPMVLYAFGSEPSEAFARRLLIDWNDIPSDLTDSEMIELLDAVYDCIGTEDQQSYWLKCLEASTGDPKIRDLIYWPDQYQNGVYADRNLSTNETLEIAIRHGTRRNS